MAADPNISTQVPATTASPTVPAHLTALVNLIEPRLIMRAGSLGEVTATSKRIVITDTPEIYVRNNANTAWIRVWPTNFSGTGVPVAANFNEGETYDRYA